MTASKKDLYKWIKIAGILSFIPIILAAGAFTGYFVGEYLKRKFALNSFISVICIGTGVASSIIESIRIIRLALNIDKKV